MSAARDPESLLHRFFEAVLNGRDRAAAEELVSRSFIDHDPMLLQEEEEGLDGLLAAIGSLHEALPDLRYEPLLLVPDDSRVAARWRMSGTSTGSLFGRPPTGNAVEVTGVDVLGIREGRVDERWSKWEQHILLKQLGIGPPPIPSGD